MRKILKEGVDFEKISEKAVAILKGKGHNVIMFTDDGMETSDPAEARRLYVKDPNFMITIDTEAGQIRINKNSNVGLEEIDAILKQLKNLAREYMLKTELKVFGKEIAPKDFAYQAKKLRDEKMNNVSEASLSRMHGSKKTSYQTLESTKLIVRHRRPVDEEKRGARSRQIKEIFIERAGERFRFPHNHLAGARAMARHIDEGGEMYDTIGNYIIESVTNLKKLVEFANYARRNKLINEQSEDVVKIVRENIAAYKRELQKFQGVKTYESMCKKLANRDETNEDVELNGELQDMFTVKKFDEKIGETLPLIKRLVMEKNAWRSMIEEASEQQFVVTSTENLIEGDAIEFDSPTQKLGYKLRTLSERVTEESDLSKFVHSIGNKMIEGKELSRFEKSVMGNVLENISVVEAQEELGLQDKLEEASIDFERKVKLLEFDLEWDDEDSSPPVRDVVDWRDVTDAAMHTAEEVHGYVDKFTLKGIINNAKKHKPDSTAAAIEIVQDMIRGNLNEAADDECPECEGHGVVAGSAEKYGEAEGCPACKGTGCKLDEDPGDWDHGYNYEGPQADDYNADQLCPTCLGSGSIEGKFRVRSCPDCDGHGIVDALGYDPETQWMDPAGGVHDNDEEDPAKMYERMLELAGVKENVDPEDFMDECPRCKGWGYIERTPSIVHKDTKLKREECPDCEGEGYV